MKFTPTLEEVKEIERGQKYKMVPIATEVFADSVTPVELVRKLKQVSGHVFMLESALSNKQWGRYTFLGYDPSLEISCMDGKTKLKTSTTEEILDENPRNYIRAVVEENKSPMIKGLPTFTGGLVGYFSYDYIKYSEPVLKLNAENKEGFSDVNLMLFEKIICFDNYAQKIILIQNIKLGGDTESKYEKAKEELFQMMELITKGSKEEAKPIRLLSEITPLFSKEEYCQMVEKAKDYIREGDIFQVVLSNRLEAKMEGSLLEAYRELRKINPSPYMFYFSGVDGELAGASPETLVKMENDKMYTFPLAGTRRRGKNESEDKALEAELLADEKELAEHNMLVDLGRNDIGKVSKIGSVKVEKYMSVERFSHVMHIGSTISGERRDDKDALDVIDAILPAGTLSGAPKLRACEIINELENSKRGVYGGAIGYLAFTGDFDTCIAIRLAFAKNGKVFVRSGAGIVADSIPENEYNECLQKAGAVMQAIDSAKNGGEI